jgi:Flp pilus assembly protein TadG
MGKVQGLGTMNGNTRLDATSQGLMTRLRHDVKGNTMAIGAAALVPLAGMVGGGIDLSRMYIVKTRLQHACDAGALAGRKAMGAGSWSYNGYAPRKTAEQFFKANVGENPYGANSLAFKFEEKNGLVTGTASAVVPMTLMQVLGEEKAQVDVTCNSELHFPNTDVMFVLDTTGSMDSKAVATDSQKKIDGLKNAVKCFYEAIAKVDTTAACSKPVSGTVDPAVQIRFGFVPYSTNVNVGQIIPETFFRRRWSYNTREFLYKQYGTTHWKYGFLEQNLNPLLTGSAVWPRKMTLPIGKDGANKDVVWDGCIEEAKTDPDPIANPSEAKDLNIDLVPTTSDPETLLKPAISGISYKRTNSRTRSEVADSTDQTGEEGTYYCPTTSKTLQKWPTAGPFEAYVDSLNPVGNTYHDIGLLWGGRLASPDGMFAADNKTTASGAPIARHLIFMTDGDTVTSNSNYSAYGIPWYDQRNVNPAGGWGDNFNAQVNTRFLAICEQIKGKNITLWVVSFGSGVSGAAQTNLRTCSSPGHYYRASSSADLEEVFNEIAGKIAELRITK